MDEYSVRPIGILHSPYREKFGIPRQPGLVPQALSQLRLAPEISAACLSQLTDFSHLWLLFLAHASAAHGWQPTVRPPRLGGNATVGVLASRSLFRPNPIGLSLVELVSIETGAHGSVLWLRGADVLDGTPIIDIKPYLPWADGAENVRAGYAPAPPTQRPVVWTETALADCAALALSADTMRLIEGVLAQDPRPAYRATEEDAREYGVWLENVNVRFRVMVERVEVIRLESRLV